MKNKKIIFTFIIILILIGFVLLGKNIAATSCSKLDNKNVAINTCPSGDYDVYNNQNLGISFNKPKNWNVFIDSGTIYIKPSPQSASGIFLTPILRAHPKMQALSFIRFAYDMAKKVYPDISLSDKRVNKNNTMAEVSAAFTNQGNKVKGFYMISIDSGRGLFCGYEDVKNSFDNSHEAMREVLKSLKIAPSAFYEGTKSGQFYSDTAAAASNAPTIDINKLVVKGGTDGTMYIAVPSDWEVGGGNFAFAANSPDKMMGVFTTNDHQPKTFDSYSYFMYQLLPFLRASGTTITRQEPNYDYMKMMQSQNTPSNAVNYFGETTNGDGIKVKFAIMVSVSNLQSYGYPTGFVTTIGVYGAPQYFDRNANVLLAMALSITADTGKIMGNLKANLDRLGKASRTMSETGDVVINAIRSSTTNTDRAIDKYNYYLSGEEARYSPLENKIYVVDSNLGSYASNPNYSQESLTAVPDSLWNKLPHERQ